MVEVAWRRVAARLGIDAEMLLRHVHGMRAEESIRRWAPPGTDVRAVADDLTAFEIREAGQTRAIDGAARFLETVPSSARALVTSAVLPLAVARMNGAGIGLPRVVVSADDVAHGKPAPDGYLLAAKRLGVEPADAVVFEDAEAGIRAGLAAGMRVIVVGESRSDVTEGLPRIDSYRDAAVAADADGVLTVRLPLAEGVRSGVGAE